MTSSEINTSRLISHIPRIKSFLVTSSLKIAAISSMRSKDRRSVSLFGNNSDEPLHSMGFVSPPMIEFSEERYI